MWSISSDLLWKCIYFDIFTDLVPAFIRRFHLSSHPCWEYFPDNFKKFSSFLSTVQTRLLLITSSKGSKCSPVCVDNLIAPTTGMLSSHASAKQHCLSTTTPTTSPQSFNNTSLDTPMHRYPRRCPQIVPRMAIPTKKMITWPTDTVSWYVPMSIL